jgi:UDP-2-acetamido-2-deoxy-ribo-hexuluronate aminotransferase
MEAIQMVDLKTQYKHIKPEIDQAVLDVIASAAFINGKPVQDFATHLAAYLGVKHVIPCANGTDALQIAMMALDLQPGDEVITPSFTYIATTEVVALLRLKPVFVDVDPQTFCMNPNALEAAITPKTKAIVPVHLYGHTAPMQEILDIAAKHNLYVIEDTAQAMGADYIFPDGTKAKAGTMGHVGCTSFFPSKNLGCYGDGGAMYTNDSALAEKLKMVANHGQNRRYYHDLIGCNSRLDTIQAAILDIKLSHLDNYNEARQKAADYYDKAFANNPKIKVPCRAPYSNHVFHQYTLILEGVNRDGLNEYLAQKGIPSMIYYPVPSHRQKAFKFYGGDSFQLPITDWLTERVISLPMHTELSEDVQDHIITEVLAFIK